MRFPGIFRGLCFLACAMACRQVALATTVIVPSDEKMIVEARAIVRGKVLSVTSSYDEARDEVFTYTTLRIQEVIKGQIQSRRIVIKEMGGQYGDHVTRVYGTPEFLPGERVLLYLGTWSDGSLRVWQMLLGKFSITADPLTGESFVERALEGEGVHVEPHVIGSVTNRMELTAYVHMVRAKLAEKWELAQEIEAAYYSSTPMLDRPPEYSARSSAGDIELQYRLFNPPARWFQPDSGQNVVFNINVDGAPSGAQTDVEAAMVPWSTVPGSALRVVSGGTTTSCIVVGGPSVVVFNNCDRRWSGSPCQNILAIGGWAGTSETRVVNGVTFNRITRGFVSFNPFSCEYGSHCNLREIATHELGHALGLHHSWDPSFGGTATASDQAATMYYIAHFDGRCAGIKQDDMNGIAFVYPGTTASFTISGKVTWGGAGVSGVTFTGSGITCGPSDSSGNYSCTVTSGWSGTITPARTGFTFNPVSRSYGAVASDQTSQGYLATALDGDGDGMPDVVETTEGTNPSVKDNDIFNKARLFVMQQYRDFLGREGDSSGITFWTDRINAGTATRAQTVDNFFSSAEFQKTTAPVTRLYFAYFLRVPDTGGLSFWVLQFKNGTSLASISQAFAQSTEFISTYGSLNNSEFVSLVYNNVLGRQPDSGGLAFWTNQLDSGAMNRGQVMLQFSESTEYRGLIFNEIYVTQIYMGMLRRAPDQGGFTFWVGQMDSGQSGLNLIGSFLAATEYRKRFLP